MTNNPATPRDAAPEFSGGGLTEPPGDWEEGVTGDPGEGEPEAEGGVAPVEGEGDEAEGEGDVAVVDGAGAGVAALVGAGAFAGTGVGAGVAFGGEALGVGAETGEVEALTTLIESF